MPKTLFITDLDGTLLGRDDCISPTGLKTLNALIEDGLSLTYATARSLSSASRVTKGLHLCLPVIVYNGAFIREPVTAQNLHSVSFSPVLRARIQSIAAHLALSPLVYSFVEGRECVSWLPSRENDGIRRYLSQRSGDPRLRPLEDETALYAGDVFYYTFIGEQAALLPLYEEVAQLEGCRCVFQQELYRPEYWCEVMPAQATKAEAARKLKELLGFERIVAFGDAINDIPLFEAADEAYAVDNAAEPLKRIATGVIGANDADGVARFLKARHFSQR